MILSCLRACQKIRELWVAWGLFNKYYVLDIWVTTPLLVPLRDFGTTKPTQSLESKSREKWPCQPEVLMQFAISGELVLHSGELVERIASRTLKTVKEQGEYVPVGGWLHHPWMLESSSDGIHFRDFRHMIWRISWGTIWPSLNSKSLPECVRIAVTQTPRWCTDTGKQNL